MTKKTMKIAMIRTLDGSSDGIAVQTYVDGQTYDVSADLAENFVGQGAAFYAGGVISAISASKESDIEAEAHAPKPPAGPTTDKAAAPSEAKPATKRRGAGK